MRELEEVAAQAKGLDSWSHAEKICFFAWYLHACRSKSRFDQAAIRSCYDRLHLGKPSNVSSYLGTLQTKKPADVLKDSSGYFLAKHIRDRFEAKYGVAVHRAEVSKLLKDLPAQLHVNAQRTFLEEVVACVGAGANRSAIVMAWNLFFDHFCQVIIAKHLTAFNSAIAVRFPRKVGVSVSTRESFDDLKESEVLAIARSANITTDNVNKILEEKLRRRNMAAHPSSLTFTHLNAEEFVTDLVNNGLLKIQ